MDSGVTDKRLGAGVFGKRLVPYSGIAYESVGIVGKRV